MRNDHTRNQGLTLIELVSSLAIVAILTGLATPNMTKLISKNRVITQSNSILESLSLARSHAINTQKNVHICHLKPNRASKSNNKTIKCDSNRDFNSKWSNGWIIFADNDYNNEFTEADELLRVVARRDKVNIVFNQRGRLRFFGNGSARSAGFYICDRQKLSFRHVYLSHSGRARINQNLTAKQKKTCDKAHQQS